MSQAYCNNCKEVIAINCHIKKAVCTCGSKGLVVASGRWNDKCGFDYFDRQGRFLKFVPHIPFEESGNEKQPEIKQSSLKQLDLF